MIHASFYDEIGGMVFSANRYDVGRENKGSK